MTRSDSNRSKTPSSRRAWIGRGFVGAGAVLGTLAALGGEALAGALLALALSAAGSALLWVARNSRAPDITQEPVRLGDGRSEPGTVVAMPRSKRVALAAGGLLMGLAFVAVAPEMLGDGDQRGWFIGALGVVIIVVGGPLLVAAALRHAALSVSDTGVTIRFRASHYTLPWAAVERAGICELTTYHRGFKQTHRQLGIAGDLDRAIGVLGSRERRAARRGRDPHGWAVTFPQTVFDLHIEDVAALVNDARPRRADR